MDTYTVSPGQLVLVHLENNKTYYFDEADRDLPLGFRTQLCGENGAVIEVGNVAPGQTKHITYKMKGGGEKEIHLRVESPAPTVDYEWNLSDCMPRLQYVKHMIEVARCTPDELVKYVKLYNLFLKTDVPDLFYQCAKTYTGNPEGWMKSVIEQENSKGGPQHGYLKRSSFPDQVTMTPCNSLPDIYLNPVDLKSETTNRLIYRLSQYAHKDSIVLNFPATLHKKQKEFLQFLHKHCVDCTGACWFKNVHYYDDRYEDTELDCAIKSKKGMVRALVGMKIKHFGKGELLTIYDVEKEGGGVKCMKETLDRLPGLLPFGEVVAVE